MTRKDYEAIAGAIATYRRDTESTTCGQDARLRLDTLDDVADILADLFEADNPRFQRNRFYFATRS